MQVYETTIVIDSLQKGEDIQNTLTNIENFIKNNGGTILKKEEWGKKRLAYEINRKQYGNYFHILFEGQSGLPTLLEREYRLVESILRYLTVRTESQHLDKTQESSDGLKSDASSQKGKRQPTSVIEESDEEVAEPISETDTDVE